MTEGLCGAWGYKTFNSFNLAAGCQQPEMIGHFFGHSRLAFWLTNFAIWLLTFPPLILAWKTIQNQHRFQHLWVEGGDIQHTPESVPV